MIYLHLYWEFLLVGLFAMGGRHGDHSLFI